MEKRFRLIRKRQVHKQLDDRRGSFSIRTGDTNWWWKEEKIRYIK